MKPALPRVLLFDLGGVLVDWDGIAPLLRLAGKPITAEDARRFWLFSPWVRKLETGDATAEAFGRGVVKELALSVSPERFLEEFAEWDRGPLPGALELLDELRGKARLACLTNNNGLHWAKLERAFAGRFERAYVSYRIGMVKPDLEVFHHVAKDLGCPPGEILFFDDNPECTEAAGSLGFRSVRVRGVAETRNALVGAGILAPTAPKEQVPTSPEGPGPKDLEAASPRALEGSDPRAT